MLVSVDVDALKARYTAAGQGHLFDHWDTLSSDRQQTFASQLSSIDVERVNAVYKTATQAEACAKAASATPASDIQPPPKESLIDTAPGSQSLENARAKGLNAIAQGKVGLVLMAGGQGTRLGSSAPKGTYDIELPSHKSLFQLQAERIIRLTKIAVESAGGSGTASPSIVWFIMTSAPTHQPTIDYFQKHRYFGLKSDDVIFFQQGTLPCLTEDGKIMLSPTGEVATAPDGNGGLYTALRSPIGSSSGDATPLSIMRSRGIEYLHLYGVDNCLVRVADPVFVGGCIERKAKVGVKVVTKTDPAESVGVVALQGGKWGVIEYSEIPTGLASAREEGGDSAPLKFRAANIVNHFYTLDFLEQEVPSFEAEMAFHIARKKIPTLAPNTAKGGALEPYTPSKPNGMKLELFVFDVFPFVESSRFAVHEVPREEEFSPLKNGKGAGSDCPETSRRDLLALQRKWLEALGDVEVGDGVEVEISPLISYAGEGLGKYKGHKFTSTTVLEP
ncbi:UDP-N-acetylglucosamine pyrophosphorylase [Tilletia horrida]|nr:UDP-N-acetylglucosamine pyrophosphorylase [Tilletia horrida]